jgi:hypothetical protein
LLNEIKFSRAFTLSLRRNNLYLFYQDSILAGLFSCVHLAAFLYSLLEKGSYIQGIIRLFSLYAWLPAFKE